MNDPINTEKLSPGTDRKTQLCPFLGIQDDPATALAFPSLGNHCHHARPVLPVKLEHQRIYCLSTNYPNCEQFDQSPDTPLPIVLRSGHSSKRWKIFRKKNFWTLLLVLAAAGLITWQVLSRGLLGAMISGFQPVSTLPALSTIAEVPTSTITPTKVPSTPTPTYTIVFPATILPSQTFTPTIEIPHALETPIGIQHKFIIHQIANGESLPLLATQYLTTIEAIQAVNFYLPVPLLVGWLMIIPPNQTDVSGLPAFEAYQVKADVAVETLVQELSIDPAMMKLYNGLYDAEILHADDWLLIPHLGTAIP
jgi:hypothetical protein